MDGDDAADAARYGLKTRYSAERSGGGREPLEQRIAERGDGGRSDGAGDTGEGGAVGGEIGGAAGDV